MYGKRVKCPNRSSRVFNVVDDLPAPRSDVIAHARSLLLLGGDSSPDEEESISGSAASDEKRVRNARLKEELGYALRFPTFKEGIEHCFRAQGTGIVQ